MVDIATFALSQTAGWQPAIRHMLESERIIYHPITPEDLRVEAGQEILFPNYKIKIYPPFGLEIFKLRIGICIFYTKREKNIATKKKLEVLTCRDTALPYPAFYDYDK